MALLLFPTFSPQVILSSPLFSIVSSLYVVVPYHIYIFRFRSYLVTDIGRILDAKGGFVNFLEA